MANQRNAANCGDDERSLLEEILETMASIDCAVDRFEHKCAVLHDILLVLSRTVEVVKMGLEELMEIDDADDDDEEDDECRGCPNWRRN